jgi:opacity protein-like surface antigen
MKKLVLSLVLAAALAGGPVAAAADDPQDTPPAVQTADNASWGTFAQATP